MVTVAMTMSMALVRRLYVGIYHHETKAVSFIYLFFNTHPWNRTRKSQIIFSFLFPCHSFVDCIIKGENVCIAIGITLTALNWHPLSGTCASPQVIVPHFLHALDSIGARPNPFPALCLSCACKGNLSTI